MCDDQAKEVDQQDNVRRLWIEAAAASKAASAARRQRVLGHQDLVDKLKRPPLAMADPSRWTGWIPPRTGPEGCCPACSKDARRPACRGVEHYAPANDSPVRKQLVAIAAEALRREERGG
jgi:hypothetical protein